jgi:2-polyprenyl-6-methoxyphenol hydroxylase-like FAD-dependent oxidoreductase
MSADEMETRETPGMCTSYTRSSEAIVLVIGAGIVGLTMAILLASQGISVTICESRDERATSRVSPQLLLSRTMEIYSHLGLAEEIEEESAR